MSLADAHTFNVSAGIFHVLQTIFKVHILQTALA